MKFKLKKEYTFLAVFVMIVAITGYVLVRFVAMSERASDTAPELLIKPAYLLQPVPKIESLKTILDNPKFQEMLYIETFFKPVEVGIKGRPNPFVPFLKKE